MIFEKLLLFVVQLKAYIKKYIFLIKLYKNDSKETWVNKVLFFITALISTANSVNVFLRHVVKDI